MCGFSALGLTEGLVGFMVAYSQAPTCSSRLVAGFFAGVFSSFSSFKCSPF